MDLYWNDTIYVFSPVVVVAAGTLLVGGLAAAALLVGWLFGRAPGRP